jgi:hypothetical protein
MTAMLCALPFILPLLAANDTPPSTADLANAFDQKWAGVEEATFLVSVYVQDASPMDLPGDTLYEKLASFEISERRGWFVWRVDQAGQYDITWIPASEKDTTRVASTWTLSARAQDGQLMCSICANGRRSDQYPSTEFWQKWSNDLLKTIRGQKVDPDVLLMPRDQIPDCPTLGMLLSGGWLGSTAQPGSGRARVLSILHAGKITGMDIKNGESCKVVTAWNEAAQRLDRLYITTDSRLVEWDECGTGTGPPFGETVAVGFRWEFLRLK